MARPIKEELHQENLEMMEEAAKQIASQRRTVSISNLAAEMGMTRQAIYKSEYLKERAEQLVEQYKGSKFVAPEFSNEEWKEKYDSLLKQYKDMEQQYQQRLQKNKLELKTLKEKLEQKESEIRRVRGERYQFDRKNYI